MPVLIIVGVALFIGLAIYLNHLQAKKRREMFSAWAQASGLVFSPAKDRRFDNTFPLPCFRRGSGRYAYNLSCGERAGCPIIAGDYHYETHSTDSKGNRRTQHHHFSFVLFQPGFPLRKLALRKEGLFDKVTAAFGFDDIDFESAEFSKAFHVKCDDRKWAYDAIHPRTMELLMRNRELRIESDMGALAAYTGKTWKIPQFEAYANVALEFLDGIPGHARELAV